jgi:hypothetical protein
VVAIGAQTQLVSVTKSSSKLADEGIEIRTSWIFQQPRDVFPWMFLKLIPRGGSAPVFLSRGLCAIEVAGGPCEEKWRINRSARIPAGDYSVEAILVDNPKRLWAAQPGRRDPQTTLLCAPIPLGDLSVPKN